ncbi:hypothetical protein Taro_030801 [Colocasia esculenta]|uniref:Uncharacterized protein n=1 Tax=Colocasia esculenta TaxID=4460 RepID=A0A843VNC8_COLES|nr:hypothetical protein [Colocasia esculenta]
MFNLTRDLLPSSWIWLPEHRRYSHPLRFFPTSSAKELGITLRTGIKIAYVTTIRSRHSETVDRALVSRNSIPGPKFPLGASDSLDYANRWRTPHAEPPSHSDRKSCSNRREISSPAKELGITFRTGIKIAYVTTIRNQHSETVDKALRLPRLRKSLPDPTRGAAQSQRSEVVFNLTRDLLPSSDSLDYANRWRTPNAEPPSHSDRKSCSTRHEISSPGRGYGCPNIADIVTPSAKELGITFRTGIKIVYVTTIRNRHSETVDRALVSRNSVPGPKFPPERTWIFIRLGVGTAREAPIQNRHFDSVGKWSHSEISGPGPKFLSGSAVVGR